LPSPIDPIASWRSRIRVVVLGGTAWLALLGAWAAYPLIGADQQDVPRFELPAEPSPPGEEPLDLSGFGQRIWNPPPPVAAAEVAAPQALAEPAKPLRLSLVAILQGHSGLEGAVYDADADRLHLVSPGDRIQGARVQEVDASGVRLLDGRREVVLELESVP
jgi:hypothetical protein